MSELAFPQSPDVQGCWPHEYGLGGMTLRDYFAAHSPPPPNGWIGGESGKSGSDAIAQMCLREDNEIYADIEWRWFYADAMLEARKPKSGLDEKLNPELEGL